MACLTAGDSLALYEIDPSRLVAARMLAALVDDAGSEGGQLGWASGCDPDVVYPYVAVGAPAAGWRHHLGGSIDERQWSLSLHRAPEQEIGSERLARLWGSVALVGDGAGQGLPDGASLAACLAVSGAPGGEHIREGLRLALPVWTGRHAGPDLGGPSLAIDLDQAIAACDVGAAFEALVVHGERRLGQGRHATAAWLFKQAYDVALAVGDPGRCLTAATLVASTPGPATRRGPWVEQAKRVARLAKATRRDASHRDDADVIPIRAYGTKERGR